MNYEKEWKIISNELEKGELNSLVPKLEKIIDHAEVNNDKDQWIRVYLTKASIDLKTNEDEDKVVEIISNLEKKMQEFSAPYKNLMAHYLLGFYKNYLQQNRWVIEDRTAIEDNDESDFKFWSKDDFDKEINRLYSITLKDEEVLKQSNLSEFQILLEGEDNFRKLRPTLYELLNFNYLQYLSQLSNYYQFWQNEKSGNYNSRTAIDSVYNQLSEFQRNQNNIGGYIITRLEQIKFHHQLDNDKELYFKNLTELLDQYPENPWVGEVLYSLAELHRYDEKPITFQPKTIPKQEPNSYSNNVEALNYLETIVRKFPKSFSAKNANLLIEAIKKPGIAAKLDIHYPGIELPLQLKYKNLDEVHLKIIKANEQDIDEISFTGWADDFLDSPSFDYIKENLSKREGIFQQRFNLINPKDYVYHSTILPLPALESGLYIVMLSNTEKFDVDNQHVFVKPLAVSAYTINQRSLKASNIVQITDSWTGKPISNEIVKLYTEGNRNFDFVEDFKTDEMGRFELRNNKNALFLKFSNESHYHLLQNYNSYYSKDDDWHNRIDFFTDRAIYRPGQVVHFKGIAIKQKKEESKVIKNQKITVQLIDANYQNVSGLELITNEFGSFHGKFVLPQGGLTGSFSLKNNWSKDRKYFNVEEYKRPKFKVELDSLNAVYSIGDKVRISGKAQAFSGNAISNAKVTVEVFASEFFPYFRYHIDRVNQRKLIHQEELTTNNKGEFKFDFLAERLRDKKESQAFNYEVIATVTDLSGETHETTKFYRLGDLPYTVWIQQPESIDLSNSSDSLTVSIRSLNNQKQNGKATLEIVKLEDINKVFRPGGDFVDLQILNKKEFEQKFPYLPYAHENQLDKRKVTETVFKKELEIEGDFKINLQDLKLEKGNYKTIVRQKFNKTDSLYSERYFNTYNSAKNIAPEGLFFSMSQNKDSLNAGEVFTLDLMTALPKANAILELYHGTELIMKKSITFSGTHRILELPITEDLEGQLFGSVYFEHFGVQQPIRFWTNVAEKSKLLNIKTSSFRDKMKPGEPEKWKLTITNHKNQAASAELLATMYDASLDEFIQHQWNFWPFHSSYLDLTWNKAFYQYHPDYFEGFGNLYTNKAFQNINFEHLNNFGFFPLSLQTSYFYKPAIAAEEVVMASYGTVQGKAAGVAIQSSADSPPPPPPPNDKPKNESKKSSFPLRKNLQETAFFFPDSRTDPDGNVVLEFTSPEALTEWRLMALAHTQDLKFGLTEFRSQTQKDFMVVPNPPRFLREGDSLNFSSKLVNLTDQPQNGLARLEIFDAFTMQPINHLFHLNAVEQDFSLSSGQSKALDWSLEVPSGVSAIVYRISAGNERFSDGEEAPLPVLSNRKLVTKSTPISIKQGENKLFEIKGLKNKSTTKRDFNLSLEFTENPIWQAVLALPYLQEFPYECSEQIFSRVFANSLGKKIMKDNPQIEQVFNQWSRDGSLASPLEKNPELKTILLQESPWVRQAQNETEQQKRIALLFEANQLNNELENSLRKLFENQNSDGGFPWFKGGKSNVYISAHLLAGFGQLLKFSAIDLKDDQHLKLNLLSAFIDAEIENLLKDEAKNLGYKSPMLWQLLYARSFDIEQNPLRNSIKKELPKILKNSLENHVDLNLYTQAQLALLMERYDYKDYAQRLLRTIKEKSVNSSDMGMYWKENRGGWYWHQARIETQALVIEAFEEIAPNDKDIDKMKIWLMSQKRTQAWESTKATTQAIFTLLNSGESWLNNQPNTQIEVGGTPIEDLKPELKKQVGNGYFKANWSGNEIKDEYAQISITKKSPGISFGGVYYQYFEDLNKIESADGGLIIRQEIYKKTIKNGREVLQALNQNSPVAVGDLVTVRLTIESPQDMEFVHLKGMRASGLEPINVLSGYRWKGGLGYYESTKDAASHFFFDWLPKGKYVFEFDARANNAGIFSMGISEIQCMYAPEFSTHSQGQVLQIER